MNHTPGPWKEWDRTEHRSGVLITNEQGNIGVCRVIDIQGSISDRTPDTEFLDREICVANARLIAACPALLGACKEAVANFWGEQSEKYRESFRKQYWPNHPVAKWEAAIAAAEGTTP